MTAPPNIKSDCVKFGHAIFPTLSFALAIIIFICPIQHYLSIGRYQHYGLAVFVWGMGYLLQTIWSWRKRRWWSRLSYLFGGTYLASLGMIFYANPWLDPKFAVQTSDQLILQFWMSRLYLVLLLPLLLVWLMGFIEELKDDLKARKQQIQPPTGS